MAVTADLDKLLDKAYENTDLQGLCDAPVAAIAGVSDADAEALNKAFGIKTIGDMGHNKYFRAAEAIVNLAEAGTTRR
ncbi:hypothetical protein GCM10023191_049150 [Actinoallomurus oryzae]|jgi:hypothetical protein|uniref:Uncharacterized protein n=1 Tax=Actinoallomurus oryzae TaxID=502180 RepID=A0ABP8QD27_9ACTN|nr:hypothetical protein [Actinoallomurus sp. NBC_01490]